VADVRDSPCSSPKLQPVLQHLQITRLGEHLTPGGRIQPGAAARTAEVVKRFARLARDAGALDSVIAGTHALRIAQNPDELLARLDGPVRILTGDEEARLGYRGVVAGMGSSSIPPYLLVVDIGGGSVELTWGRRGRVESSQSVPVGAVTLTERFLAHDPPLPTEISALRDHLTHTLDAGLSKASGKGLRVVGVGGTITSMAAIEQRLSPYDPNRVHGYRLTRRSVGRTMEELAALPLAGRRRLPGLQPERADIIVAGAVVLDHLLARIGVRSLTVSEADLLWALVLDQDLGQSDFSKPPTSAR
jgi:exopolyphosphatase / guanosine-5'-triphosphate,3'-diphosphate pyrophosphatase